MDISLFSGPATREQIAPYFTDGKAPSSINVFVVRAGGKTILIDSGFGTLAPGQSGLVPGLERLGLSPESVDFVILTHMHMDHAGGLLAHKRRVFPRAVVLVQKDELAYWTELAKRDPNNPNAALVTRVVEVYGKDLREPFTYGSEVLPGVTALNASGHTPGHTVFSLRGGGRELLVLGDLVHAAALQFALPEECASYDMDKAKAVAARVRMLSLAATGGQEVAGMHVPFPGYGTVKKKGKGFELVKE
jgi:glyoxylase-like metal-dependent hydrolase (beta-lactamase superfamily II)